MCSQFSDTRGERDGAEVLCIERFVGLGYEGDFGVLPLWGEGSSLPMGVEKFQKLFKGDVMAYFRERPYYTAADEVDGPECIAVETAPTEETCPVARLCSLITIFMIVVVVVVPSDKAHTQSGDRPKI